MDEVFMRVLALDHGTKRVGVALSDGLGMIAQPIGYWPIEPFEAFLAQLRSCIAEREVSLLLIGMPRNMNGSFGPAAKKVDTFVAALRAAVEVPIQTWDERLTTVQANRLLIEGGVRRGKRKQKVDSLAAAVLLQSFLDARSAPS